MTTPSWVNTLSDSGIKSDFSSLISTGSFSYLGAVQFFENVANKGALTTNEFNDLQTIVTNLNVGIYTPSYVVSEMKQLVDNNFVNYFWTGGGVAPVMLGNLQVGSTSTQMNELIGKWLLGTDLPSANLPANWDGAGEAAVFPTYKTFSLSLFGPSGMPSINDVAQGEVSDCVVCSAMIDMVNNHPNMLGSMILDNGNGTYDVRFYINGQATWVTVNNQLPVTANGQLVFNNAYATNDSLWSDIIEKAYVQINETGQLGHDVVNSYLNIGGNYDDIVLKSFTNSQVKYYYSSNPNWGSYKQLFIDALASGDDLLLDSEGSTTDSSGKTNLVNNHCFAIVAYDASAGDFVVRNPWGTWSSTYLMNYNEKFEVSMSDIASVNGDVAIDNSSSLTISTYSTIGAISAYQAGTINAAITITDSAADVTSNLNALQVAAAVGKISSIIFSDGGTPVLSLTAAQLSSDAAVLHDITGNYAISVPGVTSAVATFTIQQDASGRGSGGINSFVAGGTGSSTSDSVVGFQNASFTGGYDAVVLDGPRSQYTLQVDSSGGTTITDTSDNQSITVSGESYLVFNGASTIT
ncbi:C2 family cysteine protease, partial [Telmatospirillum sp.]|uniref:C2 family cysteine protease n=1 Tax=Telmatospirillum sp. TaxID=2079197 RepID=UPI00284B2317